MIHVCKNHCHHRVRLVVKLRMMHNLTPKGQIQDLTSGQGHDLTLRGHVAYQPIPRAELSTLVPL